jgi:hypothetical protein
MLNDMLMYFAYGVAFGFVLGLVPWFVFYAIASFKHILLSM